MKQFLRSFLSFLCLFSLCAFTPSLFCACASPQQFTPQDLKTYPLERQFLLKTEEGEYSVLLKMTAPLCGSLVFLSPESLSGITFSSENGQCTMETGDLKLSAEFSAMPEKGQLFKAFSLSDETTLLKSSRKEDGKSYTVYTYVDNGENYFYFLDEKGELCRVDCEGKNPFSAILQKDTPHQDGMHNP